MRKQTQQYTRLDLPYCRVWIQSLSVSYIKTSAHEEQKSRKGSLEEEWTEEHLTYKYRGEVVLKSRKGISRLGERRHAEEKELG